MATAKKSRLDELADSVTVEARPSAGAPVDEVNAEEAAIDRDTKIANTIAIYKVPRPIATIMVETGYSKGTANRIWTDRQKRLTAQREAAALGQSKPAA